MDTVDQNSTLSNSLAKNDFRMLVSDLREQNFDTIRFATYRAACKLRFIQQKVNLHLVDIWNVIESFRENGLNAVEYKSEVKISRVELLLSTVYHNLNKRLPVVQQIDSDLTIRLLISFLVAAFDRDDNGKLQVFSVKVALATLCAGKLLDKLRYIFSLISDTSGVMDFNRFCDYLKEVLCLPCAVFEGPTFSYSENLPKQIFDPSAKVTINTFLDALMADPCPPCLMWLPLLHRMASVEHVFHPVVCDACNRDSFTGFRYKCQRCHNYQLCQDCFWRGRISDSHTNQHEMKEYSSYKSPTKQLGHSISKSLQCVPGHTNKKPYVPEVSERPLDLSNAVYGILPSSPSLVRCLLKKNSEINPTDNSIDGSRPCLVSTCWYDNLDDEHKLIARYTAKLSGRSTYRPAATNAAEENLAQRATIAHLEKKNREILREIHRLQAMQSATNLSMMSTSAVGENGATVELDNLRLRKTELEIRMQQLQDTRKDLLMQLEGLMKVLKTQLPRDNSPRSLLQASNNDADSKAKDVGNVNDADSSLYGGTCGRLAQQFLPSSPYSSFGPRKSSLQSDLLSAADSITNTMTSLVQELNTAETEAEEQNGTPTTATTTTACNEQQQGERKINNDDVKIVSARCRCLIMLWIFYFLVVQWWLAVLFVAANGLIPI
ncbi:Dystrobrevin-1 [Trichinella patagoniensis]|uniref:Dystrobrevin n=1 Tax=Trichinella patagoniensis TaxID=990121 RepID=A0A0V0ZKX3_9BILA|nr:Dystrobrevin-1 [Trichinella patagoniensis]